MRSKKILLSTFLIGLLAVSCSLDENPVGFLSSENFYETESDALSAVAYAYAILPEIEYYSRHFYLVSTVPTEEFTLKPDVGASQHDLDQLRPLANNRELTDVFRYAYIGINRANMVIEEVPQIQMDEALRNQFIGEGQFLRALHYFNLVRLFGDVPLHASAIRDVDGTMQGLTPQEDIYQFIIDDLRDAIDLMDQESRYGRANQIAAWSLLSKVYLHLASAGDSGVEGFEFVTNPDSYYDLAATYSGYVVNDQSIYHLENDLREIYSVYNPGGPERIFYATVDRSGENEGNYSKMPLLMNPYLDGAVIELTDGVSFPSGWNHVIVEEGFYYSFDEEDLRRTELMVDSVIVDGEYLTYPGGGLTDPFTRKFVDPEQAGEQTSTDIPILRYSDILLTYAEAVGPTTEGYNAINAIRNRAGLEDLEPGLSQSDFRDAILDERSWELAFEGQRLFDLRRTNKMEEVLQGRYGKTIHNNAYYYEIPQIERDVNDLID